MISHVVSLFFVTINDIEEAILGYDKIPCLIRDTKQEILLRKINKIFKLEDKNNEIKGTINDVKESYSYDENRFKLKIL